MTVKLTFHPETGKLYGAQAAGYEGVDKRIDQIALLIKNDGTIYDLMKVEHTYAPPFSSAKDPIAIAGYVANNIVSGTMPVVSWRDIVRTDRDKVLLLDVRTATEYAFGSIEGAVNIPLDDLRDRLDELPEDKEIYTFCAVGLRGYLAQQILRAHGFTRVKTYREDTRRIPPPSHPYPINRHRLPHRLISTWRLRRRMTLRSSGSMPAGCNVRGR